MTYFCIFLQFLIFCTTPTEERPVRSSLRHSSKVRVHQGGFHNQPRNFEDQQSNKDHSARQRRAFLLKGKEKKKLKNTQCGKQVTKKRRNFKRKGKKSKQNGRNCKKNCFVRKRKGQKKEQQKRKDAKRRKRNTRAIKKICRKRERKNMRKRKGKKSEKKIRKSCCKKKKKSCQKLKGKRHKTTFLSRIQMQTGQGEGLVGLEELRHLERSSVYSLKVAQEYLQ